MNCKKCEADLSNEQILSEQSAHDDEVLDVLVICPECGAKHNAFTNWDDFIVV